MSDTATTPGFDPLTLLTRDLKASAATLAPAEARYLVDAYYTIQEDRIRAGGQIRAMNESGEPHAVIVWLGENTARLEMNIRKALDAYTMTRPAGVWMRSITGIGPVIAAGLLAHIDIEKAPTAGHIWSFAGLNPDVRWGKGEKRPWNARLKVLCWKLGESFKKVSGNESDVYGKIYRERKALELERNSTGAFAAQAAESLATRDIKDKELKATYLAGFLPAGRLDLRATRYAVKLFLAHLHHVLFELRFDSPPPKPYVVEHLGHAHIIGPPNWPLAGKGESTAGQKRAGTPESTVKNERAASSERTVEAKRAVAHESAVVPKRAVTTKSTARRERAVKPKQHRTR